MRNIKLIIEYNGKNFNGWQKQPNKLNIQGELEKVIGEITGEEIGLRYNTQEQLVQHLIDVTNNSIGYYTPMILRAQQVVSQLYSTETHVKNVYNLYNRIQNNVN